MPYFLESTTYRLRGHFEPDDQSYVDPAELAEWRARDPIDRLAARLGLTDAEIGHLRADAVARIDQALAEEMRRDSSVVMFGEGVATKRLDLLEAFGAERIRNTPLAERGVSPEVLDLRSLKPLDEAAILASVRKTGRLVVVPEANRSCGVGAEVAALAAEQAFHALRAPIVRLTSPDAPAPSSYPLEQAFAPQVDAVYSAALGLMSR